MSKDSTLQAEQAQREVQRLSKAKKDALARDGDHAWDHFEIVKLAVSNTTPQKFQIFLKCLWCSKTISSANPPTSMPRHLKSSNCSAKGNEVQVSVRLQGSHHLF